MRMSSPAPSQLSALRPTAKASRERVRARRPRSVIAQRLRLAIERDIDRAMVLRRASPAPGVIGREHAADEGDDRQAEPAVVAERVDVPPGVAAGTNRRVETRSEISRQRRLPARERRHRHARPRMHAAARQIKARQTRPRPRPVERRPPAVRGRAVERAAGRRKPLREIRRRRPLRRSSWRASGRIAASGPSPPLRIVESPRRRAVARRSAGALTSRNRRSGPPAVCATSSRSLAQT